MPAVLLHGHAVESGQAEVRWQRWERDSPFGDRLESLNALFDACFRIQREASEAATEAYGCARCGIYHPATKLDGCEFAPRYIPMVVENVKGAQPWVGRAKAHYGSYYLWGDVEDVGGRIVRSGPLEFGMASVSAKGHVKVDGFNFHQHEKGMAGGSFQSAAVAVSGVKQPGHSGRAWLADPDVAAHFPSNSPRRKAASAMIARIPFPLSLHIAECFWPSR